MTELEQIADALLWEWYLYSKSWRPPLGMPGCDPACRQAKTSRQYDTTTEIVEDVCRRIEMESVEWCHDELNGVHRNAIGIEMKNREVKAKVWRSPVGAKYEEAIVAIIPFMRKKNLL